MITFNSTKHVRPPSSKPNARQSRRPREKHTNMVPPTAMPSTLGPTPRSSSSHMVADSTQARARSRPPRLSSATTSAPSSPPAGSSPSPTATSSTLVYSSLARAMQYNGSWITCPSPTLTSISSAIQRGGMNMFTILALLELLYSSTLQPRIKGAVRTCLRTCHQI
ncbi:uncharacterized protein BT62DRAFT_694144 [Guyanagaster necrorhizus]|uniref:Uncharacterized protein n=1 Tax=Guyanagaster necrorhizus TaxID=856835 RepID=A0A9P7VEW6_9AGAR|nr:uncharacterized protein BT62DRAFT_694144 [Guyanagaster necrorhizus MCA 3950]KAG7439666.1 hypothetical protein BT62DRAFT_694144 [Guyanagaster necrorhizus MCA 3950]